MISDKITLVLMVAYVALSVICLMERNYPRALYWFGASVLMVSVLWGMR